MLETKALNLILNIFLRDTINRVFEMNAADKVNLFYFLAIMLSAYLIFVIFSPPIQFSAQFFPRKSV